MGIISLTLDKVTPSSNGGYINTWKSGGEQVQTPMGVMKTQPVRFCTKSLNEQPIGTVANINLDNFVVHESEPFVGEDGLTHITKWLRLK